MVTLNVRHIPTGHVTCLYKHVRTDMQRIIQPCTYVQAYAYYVYTGIHTYMHAQ